MTPVTLLEAFVRYASITVTILVFAFVCGVSLLGCRTASAPSAVEPADMPAAPASANAVLLEDLLAGALYPPGNWWGVDITNAPVDPASDDMLRWIGGRQLHPDFGPPPYGIPYLTVSASTPRVPITFVDYPEESDAGAPGSSGYPIPDEGKSQPNYIEGGVPGGGSDGDRHLLLFDQGQRLLFETWATRFNASENRWEASSGAVFDLTSNTRRPEGWTSADAAGLAILPGLVRYDEVYGSGEIEHAFRVTVRATDGHVWPASHTAGATSGAPPMGTRLRLRASKDLSNFSETMQRIFRAMKTYGLIVADNGSDMFVTGTMDPRWNNDVLNPAFRALTSDDFEVISLAWR